MSGSAATYDLGKLHGGLRLPGEKLLSTSIDIYRGDALQSDGKSDGKKWRLAPQRFFTVRPQ